MTDSSQIAANINGDQSQGPIASAPADLNPQFVASVAARFQQQMPQPQQMAQFEQILQQSGDFAKVLTLVCPELIAGFVAAAQNMQQDQTVQGGQPGMPPVMQQGGMTPPGGNNGMSAPQQPGAAPMGMAPPSGMNQAPQLQAPQPGPEDDQDSPQAQATSFGNPPPSTPTAASPLRKQFFTAR